MRQFNPKPYYKMIVSREDGIELKQKGRELIAEYYNKKYKTNIVFPFRLDSSFIASNQPTYSNFATFLMNIEKHLENPRQQKGEFRQAFLFGANEGHAIPVIYLKETIDGKEEEGLFIADSMGLDNVYTDRIAIERIKERSNIPVYVIKEQRQKDFISCFTDALIFGRDTTAKVDEHFRLKHLLKKLKNRARQNEAGLYEVLIPDVLLKTAQLPRFVVAHSESRQKPIYKTETLEMFRNRYRNDSLEPAYLLEKGLKFSELIEILFYVNELKSKFSTQWNDEIEKEFIFEAKSFIQASDEDDYDLFSFVEEFSHAFRKRINVESTDTAEDERPLKQTKVR